MNIDFKKKNILITGTSRGIGKELAESFFKKGANIFSTSTQRKKTRFSKIGGNKWTHFSVDFNNDFEVKAFIRRLEKLPRIDILINNAGVNKIEDFTKIKEEDWLKINKINLTLPYLISKTVSRKMKQQKKGHIINISSIFGVISKKKRATYSASKSGLIGLTKAMSLDLAGSNILVNSVSPGFVKTDLTRNILTNQEIKALSDEVPLKRFAQSKEIVQLVTFLCSKFNTYITGQNLVIDGGYTIK